MKDENKLVLTQVEDFLDTVSKQKVFAIKFSNTPKNRDIHKAFIKYAWDEHDGGYFQAIKSLMEYIQGDFKYATLYDDINRLRKDVEDLRNLLQTKEEPKQNKFFGEE